MSRFTSSDEAKSYIVSRLIEQAGREGVKINEFERRLLDSTASEEELDEFEDRDDGAGSDELCSKIGQLAIRALKADREVSSYLLGEAFESSALKPGYLDSILRMQGVYRPPLITTVRKRYRRWLLFAVVCLIGGMAFSLILVFAGPTIFGLIDKFMGSDLAKAMYRVEYRYGLAFFLALLVTALVAALRQLRTREFSHRIR